MLEATRKIANGADTVSGATTSYGRSGSKSNTLMTRQPQATSKSPLRATNEAKEKKKSAIAESSERLSSPPRKANPVSDKDEDLIFSIKMSKEEYTQYKKMREQVKTETAKPTKSTARNITPVKKR